MSYAASVSAKGFRSRKPERKQAFHRKSAQEGNSEKGKWRDLNYKEQVDFVINSRHVRELGETGHTNDRIIGSTPDYLIKVGYSQLPLLYTKKHLLLSVTKKVFNTGESHAISISSMKKIPTAIQYPVALFRSATRDNQFVILTNLLDDHGAPVIMSVLKNGHGWVDRQQVKANFVTSIYGKDENFGRYIDRAFDSGRMIFCNRDALRVLMKNAKVTIPCCVSDMDFENEEEEGLEL